MATEWKVIDCSTSLSVNSIGFQDHPERRPTNRAEAALNALAPDGWVLHEMQMKSQTMLVLVLKRETEPEPLAKPTLDGGMAVPLLSLANPAKAKALASLRQGVWEASQFQDPAAMRLYIEGVLAEIEDDEP